MHKRLIASIVSIILTMAMTAPSLASGISTTTADGSKIVTSNSTVIRSVTKVRITRSSLTLIEGDSRFLTARITPTNATNQNVTWGSNNVPVATVDSSGNVVGVKAGAAIITVTTLDGRKTATCPVTVKAPPVAVTGVSLNTSSETINAYTSITLGATVSPRNATNQKVTWKSSNTAVAKVDKTTGLVTGKKAGTATITVTTSDGKKKATCKITVVLPKGSVTGVKLNKTSLTLYKRSSKTLEATVSPSNAINKDVTWMSLDSSIASVDSNGRVTALDEGTTSIMVMTVDGKKTAYCKVKVKD